MKTNPPIASTKTKTKSSGSANVSVEAKASRTSSQNIATAEREKVVAEVRKDAAVAFSDAEEAFFASAGDDKAVRPAMLAAESFDDLDEGYQPVGFWDRVFGRKKAKPKK
ncbi:MAG: hypothetical protein H0T79_16400 [Deltaproteobacteria bacterium]|nr:hypothetical protein [Deltaproteobacteria bacterium]